ncbi:glycyl-radical enzyme activating protein [Sporolactobacillus sp. CQH2019]|uniref:glycyl-radical enzyme activating protein n=1 Tax=Sporolactobacillus sp. CQH2019 TaxID=3023512 RepID=UPI002367E205|nr:glycyl-radical enzyme activating protein [Sporolactobacillus sp. CQH2019]MDD9150280.1 glycyl-radical enzyme activating protein [Sporolactobacillus sp. CQH2019]
MLSKERGCIFNIQRFSIHDGPGIRTSIFFKGCPLRCPWCANPESQKAIPEKIWDKSKNAYTTVGKYLTIAEIMNPILKDIDYYKESGGGVTVTGGEILNQIPFVVKLLKECRKNNISVACETSAFASLRTFKLLLENIDLLIIDIKHYDNEKHKQATGVSVQPILRALDYAISTGKNMLVRIPIIPGFNDSIEDAKRLAILLKEHRINEVELLPFHQFGKNKYKFLNRPYSFENVKPLHGEDLIPIKSIITGIGIKCSIS